jgi:hypothetical protein
MYLHLHASFVFGASLHDSHFKFGRAQDPVKFLQAAEQRAREYQVAVETIRILRRDVIECYRREGVNHYENCREVAARYYHQIKKKDIGVLQPNWEDPSMAEK